jgi:hypothetical protein
MVLWQEALAAAELELESDTDHRRQFTSLLEVCLCITLCVGMRVVHGSGLIWACVSLQVVEEQQGMVVELKEKQQTLQSEVRHRSGTATGPDPTLKELRCWLAVAGRQIQRLLVQEADWRARSRQWQRERGRRIYIGRGSCACPEPAPISP